MDGIKFYIIPTGTLTNDINLCIGGSVIGTRDNPQPETQWITVPTYVVLIDHPDEGYILFDLGCTPDAEEVWTEQQCSTSLYNCEEGESLINGLAKLGLKPEDINKVIISHMHNDHIGNIRYFKHADFWVTLEEAKHAFTLVNGDPDPATHGFYLANDVMMPVNKRHYIEEDGEIFPGIDAILCPGHTPGVMSIIVHLKDKSVIFTSDAANCQANYDGAMPGVIDDSAAIRKSVKKLHKIQNEYDAEVFFPHDMEQFKTFKIVPEFYE